MLTLLLSLSTPAAAVDLDPLFARAAEDYQVPEAVLKAMAYEASRFDAEVVSVWGGYGLFDFPEPDFLGPARGGPDVERVSALLGADVDDVMIDPALQIQGAAALLAEYAEVGGASPEIDDIEGWADAIAGFSGRQEAHLQEMYVSYIFEIIDRGFAANGVVQPPIPVDVTAARSSAPPPLLAGDYSGNDQFVSASSSNYSNYSRTASGIDTVVIHTVQGSYSGCISWFQNSAASASAHYVVSTYGEVTQMVLEEDVAWHAGHWDTNYTSVGIEHEGYIEDPGTWYTDAMYAASAALSSDIISRNGVTASRSWVIAHAEVPGCAYGSGGGSSCHTDPGSGWDWDYYMGLIGGDVSSTATLMGVVGDGDIYDAELRIEGATITLNETGETTTTDSDGYWEFPGLSAGSWTVTASAPGFEDGSCTSNISSAAGDWWCSMALDPGGSGEGGSSGGGSNEGGSDDDNTGAEDTGEDLGDPGEEPGADPGDLTLGASFGADERVLVGEMGCSAAPAAPALLWVIGLAAVARRRD